MVSLVLPGSNLCQNIATCGSFCWQIVTVGKFWQQVSTYGDFWQQVSTCGNFYHPFFGNINCIICLLVAVYVCLLCETCGRAIHAMHRSCCLKGHCERESLEGSHHIYSRWGSSLEKKCLHCSVQVEWKHASFCGGSRILYVFYGWGGARVGGVTQGHGGSRGAPLLSRVVAKRGAASQPLWQ